MVFVKETLPEEECPLGSDPIYYGGYLRTFSICTVNGYTDHAAKISPCRLLNLHPDTQDTSNTFPRNICKLVPGHAASYPGRQEAARHSHRCDNLKLREALSCKVRTDIRPTACSKRDLIKVDMNISPQCSPSSHQITVLLHLHFSTLYPKPELPL
jgi:hypothetical protein